MFKDEYSNDKSSQFDFPSLTEPEVAVDVVGVLHEDVLVEPLGAVVLAQRLVHAGKVVPGQGKRLVRTTQRFQAHTVDGKNLCL